MALMQLRRLSSLVLETRYRVVAILLALYLAVSLLTRIALLAAQHALAGNGVPRVLAALGVGEIFDLLAALWLAMPLVLYLTAVPERWFQARFQRAILTAWVALAPCGSAGHRQYVWRTAHVAVTMGAFDHRFLNGQRADGQRATQVVT